jgi:segregation and condensation protein A
MSPMLASNLTTPMPHFKVPAFEGPIDLLLHLIRANQVDISDIPIAEITQQYLAMMELFEALDLQVAGEYVLLAATLIEIKSRMLLPVQAQIIGDDPDEDPRAELVARLREYQAYQASVETFREWEEIRRSIFFRGAAAEVDDYILPIQEGEATPIQLFHAIHRMLAEAGVDEKPVTAVTSRRRLSLRFKMAEILRKVISAGTAGLEFERLFSLPCTRYEIVLSFLAILELLRLVRVRIKQAGVFGSIMLYELPQVAVVSVRQ